MYALGVDVEKALLTPHDLGAKVHKDLGKVAWCVCVCDSTHRREALNPQTLMPYGRSMVSRYLDRSAS